MLWLLLFPLTLILLALLAWNKGRLIANDYSIPTLSKKSIYTFKKLLIVYPHADDEVLTCGGLTQILSMKNIHSTLLILTMGEKGTQDAHLYSALKSIRTKEAREVAKLIKVRKVIQEDIGDGQVKKNKEIAMRIIKRTIERENPDLVITYDLAGMYGHEDHITTSEITTDLIHTHFPSITLWYVTQPKTLIDCLKLPEHMAKDKEYFKKRAVPTHKVYIGRKILNKIRGVYAYKSQFGSFKRSRPVKFLPVWLQLSVSQYEYYMTAHSPRTTLQE